MHAGDQERRLVGDQTLVALEKLRLLEIVDLLHELAFCFAGEAGDVEVERQQVEQAEQCGHVVHVALDRARNAGILDLQREVAAVARTQHGALARSTRRQSARTRSAQSATPNRGRTRAPGRGAVAPRAWARRPNAARPAPAQTRVAGRLPPAGKRSDRASWPRRAAWQAAPPGAARFERTTWRCPRSRRWNAPVPECLRVRRRPRTLQPSTRCARGAPNGTEEREPEQVCAPRSLSLRALVRNPGAPPRDSRRHQFLSGWGHEHIAMVFPGSPGTPGLINLHTAAARGADNSARSFLTREA